MAPETIDIIFFVLFFRGRGREENELKTKNFYGRALLQVFRSFSFGSKLIKKLVKEHVFRGGTIN